MPSLPSWAALVVLGAACRPEPVEPDPPADCEPVVVERPVPRLSRERLIRGMADLTGIDAQAVHELPPDPRRRGLDNDAELLGVDAAWVSAWESAVIELVAALVEPGDTGWPAVLLALPESPTLPLAPADGDDRPRVGLFDDAVLTWPLTLAEAGPYEVQLDTWWAWGSTWDQAAPTVIVSWDGVDVAEAVIEGPTPMVASVTGTLGDHVLGVRLADPVVGASATWEADGRVRLSPEDVVVVGLAPPVLSGPVDAPAAVGNPARAALLDCDPAEGVEACVVPTLVAFAERAWRRPVGVEALGVLARLGDDPERALALGLTSVLLAPDLVFQIELDPDPTAGTVSPLDDHELATRLAAFTWASFPDAALRADADAGRLGDPAVLEAQVLRMLADPRADAMARVMAAGWLGATPLDSWWVDPSVGVDMDDTLRAGLRSEVEGLFADLVETGRPLTDLLLADHTWATPEVAALEGLVHPGTGSARLPLPEGRLGLLGMAGWLTATSTPARTSPATRGSAILARMLCDPTGPARVDDPRLPPEAEAVDADQRALLSALTSDPACSACHDAIDPLGFGLEAFDPVGRERHALVTGPVDASGEFDGHAFDDQPALARLLHDDPRWATCVASTLARWAWARDLVDDDSCAVERVEQGGLTLEALALSLARSAPFLSRVAQGQEAP